MKFIVCFLIVGQTLAEHWPNLDPDATANPSAAESSIGCKSDTWVPVSNGKFPLGTFRIGAKNGKLLYLARAYFDGELIPGKLYAGQGFFLSNGHDKKISKYEIFCSNDDHWTWIRASKENIPSNALIAGENKNSEPLYVCRIIKKDGNVASGKVENGECKIGTKGTEEIADKFEILVERN